MFGWSEINEHGMWCTFCGAHLASSWEVDETDWQGPEQCPRCGAPDEFDPVRAGFVDEDEIGS